MCSNKMYYIYTASSAIRDVVASYVLAGPQFRHHCPKRRVGRRSGHRAGNRVGVFRALKTI